MVIGTLMVMAASPPVASRISLPEFHFVWRQLVYLVPAMVAILFLSLMTPRMIKSLILAWIAWGYWADDSNPADWG